MRVLSSKIKIFWIFFFFSWMMILNIFGTSTYIKYLYYLAINSTNFELNKASYSVNIRSASIARKTSDSVRLHLMPWSQKNEDVVVRVAKYTLTSMIKNNVIGDEVFAHHDCELYKYTDDFSKKTGFKAMLRVNGVDISLSNLPDKAEFKRICGIVLVI